MNRHEHDDVAGDDSGVGSESWHIVSRFHMWIWWARTARDNAKTAAEARHALADARAVEGGDGGSSLLDIEGRAALVAVCSAVFAVESVSIALRDHVVDDATLTAWKTKTAQSRNTSAADKLGQILQRSIGTRSTADNLTARWMPLYKLRGQAVHFEEHELELADHPSGTRADPFLVEYSSELADSAVAVLTDTLCALRDDPKRPARFWADAHRGSVNEFG